MWVKHIPGEYISLCDGLDWTRASVCHTSIGQKILEDATASKLMRMQVKILIWNVTSTWKNILGKIPHPQQCEAIFSVFHTLALLAAQYQDSTRGAIIDRPQLGCHASRTKFRDSATADLCCLFWGERSQDHVQFLLFQECLSDVLSMTIRWGAVLSSNGGLLLVVIRQGPRMLSSKREACGKFYDRPAEGPNATLQCACFLIVIVGGPQCWL